MFLLSLDPLLLLTENRMIGKEGKAEAEREK